VYAIRQPTVDFGKKMSKRAGEILKKYGLNVFNMGIPILCSLSQKIEEEELIMAENIDKVPAVIKKPIGFYRNQSSEYQTIFQKLFEKSTLVATGRLSKESFLLTLRK
jgi:hypothetical protein